MRKDIFFYAHINAECNNNNRTSGDKKKLINMIILFTIIIKYKHLFIKYIIVCYNCL